MTIDYTQLLLWLMPEVIVLVGALVVLFVDLGAMRPRPIGVRARVAVYTGCFFALAAILWIAFTRVEVREFRGMLVLNDFSAIIKTALLALSVVTMLLFLQREFTTHIGEYLALILMATIGLMLLVSTEELLVAFVALELVSLCLYVLTAFHKQNITSIEAGLKYFLFGSVSAAFTLFGLSLLFGAAGSTNFHEIAVSLRTKTMDPLLILALVLTAIGFGFKIAAVPMHLWAPDAYQGAPIPSVAFLASGSKIAGFILFAKLFMIAFAGQTGSAAFGKMVSGWSSVLAVLALFSMILGNLLAIAQPNVRRLLAYSAIAHAGYALLGVMAASATGLSAIAYYMITYGLAVVGAFAVVGYVEKRHGEAQLSDFAGLYKRAPFAALCLMIFILSLAGIPPLAGFFGKFYVFVALLKSPDSLGLLWLVIAAVAASSVSLYYYLQILKQAFVTEAPEGPAAGPQWAGTNLVLGGLALAVLLLGLFPNILVGPLDRAVNPPPVQVQTTSLALPQ